MKNQTLKIITLLLIFTLLRGVTPVKAFVNKSTTEEITPEQKTGDTVWDLLWKFLAADTDDGKDKKKEKEGEKELEEAENKNNDLEPGWVSYINTIYQNFILRYTYYWVHHIFYIIKSQQTASLYILLENFRL